jgi:trigger factor
MQYATEDLTPVKKKITVTVPVEECEAALASTIAMYRTSVTLDGFRKGKAPASIIEARFHKEIQAEATTELVNVHINEIITENKFSPVSRIDYRGGNIERGSEFVYDIVFEVMPVFDLPSYEGFELRQEEAGVSEEEIAAVIDRVRHGMAEIVPVEDRAPEDGDVAVIDFAAVDENGELIAGIKADGFQLTLGQGQTLPDFEILVKSMRPGEKREGPVSFPADFFNSEFAGRTVTMNVTLHALRERRLPALDDEFAQKAGKFENVEKLRDSVRQSCLISREELHKAEAQNRLLDSLLKLTDFPLPESMVESHIAAIMDDMQGRLERQGKSLASLGKTPETIREEVRPEAEKRARTHIFLLAVARARDLSVTEQEVDAAIRRIAMRDRQDVNSVKEYYAKNNLLFALRDQLLADKGMEELYSKAAIRKTAPGEERSGDDGDAAEVAAG